LEKLIVTVNTAKHDCNWYCTFSLREMLCSR